MHITMHDDLLRRYSGHRSGQTGEISDEIRAEPHESQLSPARGKKTDTIP